jgi:hypothetical protein
MVLKNLTGNRKPRKKETILFRFFRKDIFKNLTHTQNSMANHRKLLALLRFWLCSSSEHNVSELHLFLKHGSYQIIWPKILNVNSVRTIKNLFTAICFQYQNNCLFQICSCVQTTVKQAFSFHIMEWYSCASDENKNLLTGQMYFALWQRWFWHSSFSKSVFGQKNKYQCLYIHYTQQFLPHSSFHLLKTEDLNWSVTNRAVWCSTKRTLKIM